MLGLARKLNTITGLMVCIVAVASIYGCQNFHFDTAKNSAHSDTPPPEKVSNDIDLDIGKLEQSISSIIDQLNEQNARVSMVERSARSNEEKIISIDGKIKEISTRKSSTGEELLAMQIKNIDGKLEDLKRRVNKFEGSYRGLFEEQLDRLSEEIKRMKDSFIDFKRTRETQ